MSVPVALAELAARIEEHGDRAYLVTVSAAARPHVVSVLVGWVDDRLVVAAGSRTLANATGQPTVTLLWPPLDGGSYSLIVDGTAESAESSESSEGTDDREPALRIRPDTAVLHRLAGVEDEGPTCVPVLDR